MTATAVTRFGAPWSAPRTAVAVLRARAQRFGDSRLTGVSEIDAAAAVVGVDMWMLAVGATSLDNPARYGTSAVLALSALLARAAGWAKSPTQTLAPQGWPTDSMLSAAEDYEEWVASVDLPLTQVFARSVADLERGAADPRLARAAQALRPFAETL
jgi:hypothetical protein